MADARQLFLVVDDEPLFVRSVVDAVAESRPDLRVIGVGNGAEALAVIAGDTVSVLFTDLKMPVMGGLELLARLMAEGFQAPIIVATAFGTATMERRIRLLPSVYYLEKPVDLDELLAILDRLLAQPREKISRGLGAFLQLLAAERQTILVHLRSGRRKGYLAMLDGSLVDAGTGRKRGDAAALAMLRWSDLAVELKAGRLPRATTVETPLAALVERAAAKPDAGAPAPAAQARKRAREHLARAMAIDGALGLALVDFSSGRTLCAPGSAPEVEQAACGNTELVQAKMRVIRDLELDDGIEDILITLGRQYHLIRPLAAAPSSFLYLAIDRAHGNLGMARRQLAAVERALGRA